MTWMLAILACGAEPPGTPDSGTTTGDTGTATVPAPEWCQEPLDGALQEVTTDHPAAPYFLSHPMAPSDDTQTVIFLGGGPGDQGSAQASWDLFFTMGDGVAEIRAVLPWADSGSLSDEPDRIGEVVDEVLACYGGDRSGVHLAGTSNGGRLAYDLALAGDGRYATLMGVPGVPSSWQQGDLAEPLADMRIYNGVGSDDTGWKSEVARVHEAMIAEGLDATYAEFEDQGHVVNTEWDETVLYDFWLDR